MDAGGAQKSLVSFLNTLPSELFEVTLMLINTEGILFKQIPPYVLVLDAPVSLKALFAPISSKFFWKNPSLKYTLLKTYFAVKYRLLKNNQFSFEQNLWKYWSKYISELRTNYDISMAYIEGLCSYYLVDKVSAKSKILWVHTDYNKVTASPLFDLSYFELADSIVTISDICKISLQGNFPQLSNKIKVLANISSKQLITEMAEDESIDDKVFTSPNGLKLLSIGRLSHEKGFDVAVDVANILRKKGHSFCWFVIGEGSQRKMLIKKIKKMKLDQHFKLLGLKTNPYYYISKADIIIQPSRWEGKSIVLDEAKILCKPILVTDYPTVTDSIENNKNGIIVHFEISSIVKGIEQMIINADLRDALSKQLHHSNEEEIEKYLEIMKT